MSGFHLAPAADAQIDAIYQYTADQWGEAQADRYIQHLFAQFAVFAARGAVWRPIPEAFGIEGHYGRAEQHIVYWRQRRDGAIEIMAILHERMHQLEQLRAVWEP